MSSLLSKKIIDKPRQQYFIYYDEWTGDIKHITNKHYSNLEDHYIKTDSQDASKLIKGEIDRKKYMVTDIENVPTLIPRHQYLTLKKAENALSLVPETTSNRTQELNIVFYSNSYKMEVNLSEDLIYKLTGTRYGKKLTPTGENFPIIELYLIHKKNPQHLLDTVRINPFDLINEGYLLHDLAHLKTRLSIGDISVLTKRIFSTYGIKRKEVWTGSADYGKKKTTRRHQISLADGIITNNKNVDKDFMFSVSQTTGAWIVKSLFDDATTHNIYRDIVLFVTNKNPNEYLGKIHVPYEKIGQYQEHYIKTDIALDKAHFIVKDNNKHITMIHKELEYVQSGTNN